MKASSIPLQITARVLSPAMLALSLVVLARGHHLPGGGFIGGLLAASGIVLILLGNGIVEARRSLRIRPVSLIVAGLACSLVSGVIGPVSEAFPIMGGVWLPEISLPLLGVVHLGTPLLFDVGVYLVVIGFILTCMFALVETDNEPGYPEVI